MKESPQDLALHRNLEGSKFSGEGFLGSDHRPVEEIIEDDARTLEQLGIEKDDLVEALRTVFGKAKERLGAPAEVAPGVQAVYHESMGKIPSPFRGDGVFEKGDVVVKDTNSHKSMTLTALGIVLIEKHGFFQGRGAYYRIDPATAVEVLKMK